MRYLKKSSSNGHSYKKVVCFHCHQQVTKRQSLAVNTLRDGVEMGFTAPGVSRKPRKITKKKACERVCRSHKKKK